MRPRCDPQLKRSKVAAIGYHELALRLLELRSYHELALRLLELRSYHELALRLLELRSSK
jgi:hypothetical protein